jgi:DNA-directed RNA polymerase subunit RPC12/RpoP/predicted RNA-binding Zn-ribbon protein involved in translation (DUF1610 family)
LNNHIATYHTFTCPYCGSVVTTQGALDTHIANNHVFQCPYCNTAPFTTQQALMEHIQVYHNIPCPYCSLVFNTVTDRDNHISAEHTYTCPYCGGTIVGKYSTFESHVQGCESNPANQTFINSYDITITNDTSRGGINIPVDFEITILISLNNMTKVSENFVTRFLAGESKTYTRNIQENGTYIGKNVVISANVKALNGQLLDSRDVNTVFQEKIV